MRYISKQSKTEYLKCFDPDTNQTKSFVIYAINCLQRLNYDRLSTSVFFNTSLQYKFFIYIKTKHSIIFKDESYRIKNFLTLNKEEQREMEKIKHRFVTGKKYKSGIEEMS